jgi:hypothetical protein
MSLSRRSMRRSCGAIVLPANDSVVANGFIASTSS